VDMSTFDLSAERVLIAGGGGFIGHHLALALRQTGAEVIVVDNLSHNNLGDFWSDRKLLPPFKKEIYLRFLNQRLDMVRESGCTFLNVDSEDQGALRKVFDEYAPTRAFHLAAVANASVSDKVPDLAFGVSLISLKNTLECVRQTESVQHLVWLSSSMIYGDFPPEGVTEETPVKPRGVYAALKQAGESLVIAYNQIYGIPYTIARPSALYGPRCVSRRVTSVFVENAIEGKPLRVEGDGEEKLDFTNIHDLVQGLVLTVVKPEGRNEIFNLTYGEHRSINDLVEVIRQSCPEVVVERVPRDHQRPFRGTLKVDRARRRLGYAPEYPIERGIPDLIAWYRRELDLVAVTAPRGGDGGTA